MIDRKAKLRGAMPGRYGPTARTVLWVLLAAGIGLCGITPRAVRAIVGMAAPEMTGSVWINSEPISPAELRGKVGLVEFWTFGCRNCRNVEPWIKKWHEKFSEQGLVVVGVHSPEFAYEKDIDAVKRYVRQNRIPYAVAVDNDFSIWNRYANHYWPAIYLIDKRGIIRYDRFGEGGYAETEQTIRRLLAESP
jgi:thiol-disulfide isomerase/thioredoxin